MTNSESLPLVRPIEPRDAAQVALLCVQLGYERTEEEVRNWIMELSSCADRQAAWVAVIEGEVVGWIEVSLTRHLQSPPSAQIGGLVVKEGVRGSGIGRRLCQQAETWTWQQPVASLRVNSRTTRPGAHRFYLRDGYRQIKTSLVFEKHRPQP